MPTTQQKVQYDVFISDRRTTADHLALALQRELERLGVHAFLDTRSLLPGEKFDESLLEYIAEAPYFLVILTPNVFKHFSDVEDWLRIEVLQAINTKRKIIPLKVDRFEFTTEMRKGADRAIQELTRCQAVDYSSAYFEKTIERIVEMVTVRAQPNIAFRMFKSHLSMALLLPFLLGSLLGSVTVWRYLDSRNAEEHLNIGDALYGENCPNAAKIEYTAALKKKPNSAAAHNGLGKIFHYYEHNNVIAMQEYEKALRIDPDYAPAQMNLDKIRYANKPVELNTFP